MHTEPTDPTAHREGTLPIEATARTRRIPS